MNKKYAEKETPLTNKFPDASKILMDIAKRLGINVAAQVGPMNDILLGDGSGNPNQVGHTVKGTDKIWVDFDNFTSKVRGLGLSSEDILNFFNESAEKFLNNSQDQKDSVIIDKMNALKYLIEFIAIPIHERGHNPVNSKPDEIKGEGEAQAVENRAKVIMANKGLDFLRDYIDALGASDYVKKFFNEIASDYRASISRYASSYRSLDKKIIRLANDKEIRNTKYYKRLTLLAGINDKDS